MVSLAALRSLPALAEPAVKAAETGESAEYKTAIGSAVSEFSAGNFPEARGLFIRAHALYPNARTYRGIGVTAFELRNYGICVDNLEAALASTEKPLTESLRKETEGLLVRARAFIARVDLEVTPRSARILVDGVPVELNEGQILMLEVGNHLVEVEAGGYQPERRMLNIAGGEQLTLRLAMRQPSASSAFAPARSNHERDDTVSKQRWYRNPWLWAGVAVTVVGVGIGVGLALRPDASVEAKPTVATQNTPKGGVFTALRSW